MMTPRMASKESGFQIKAKSLSIKAAKATKATTFATMIRINRPAPKIESPKKEKNGSRFSPSCLTVSIVSSSSGTTIGFINAVAIRELTMLIGTAVRINCPGIISM